MSTEQTPGALVREIREYLGANAHLSGVEDSMLDDAALDLARVVLGLPVVSAEPIQVTDVAMVSHDPETLEPRLDLLLEGGLDELPDGATLVWAHRPITDDTGHGEVFLAAQRADPVIRESRTTPDPVLDAPAKVGAVRFGAGIKWSTVIGAAQRLYQHEVTPEKEAERIARGREAIAKIQHELAQVPDALRWQALRRAAATNDEDFLRRVTEALADDRTPTEDEIDAAVDAAMEDCHA